MADNALNETSEMPHTGMDIFKFHALLPVMVVFLVTTSITVGLRFSTRKKYAKLGWDDWIMAMTLVCGDTRRWDRADGGSSSSMCTVVPRQERLW
jgi:hypothetical protein